MKNILQETIFRIITGRNKLGHIFLWPLLALLSFLYSVGIHLRALLFDIGILRIYRSERKVISVGNLTMGGTGKTPVVAHIVKLLREKEFGVAVLTRGYMAENGVTSDEAKMLQELAPNAHVYAAPDRVASMITANNEHIIQVFVLDDGFQHWRVARDLDIVLIDSVNPFGNGYLIPCGPLREPISALKRADIVILTRADAGRDNIPRLRQQCAHLNPKVAIIEATHAPASVTNLQTGVNSTDLSVLKDDVWALCAIGSPEAFQATLEGIGARVVGMTNFMDHHVYSEDEVRAIAASCLAKGIPKIVITHKDAVKLFDLRSFFFGAQVFVLNVEIKVTHGENELASRLNSLLYS